MNLLEKIDEIQANSVTPEEFEETWGKSLDQYKSELADYVEHLYEERHAGAEVDIHPAENRLQPAAPAAVAEAAAAAAETAGKKERKEKTSSVNCKETAKKGGKVRLVKLEDSGTMKEVAEAIKILAKKLVELKEKESEESKGKVKGRRLVKQKEGANEWALKLVAVQTGSGKTIAAGAPVVIRSLDRPAEEGRIVARVYTPGKKERMGLPEVKFEGGVVKVVDATGGIKELKLTDGVKGLMVDVGGLRFGDIEPCGPKGVKGPNGPKGPKM